LLGKAVVDGSSEKKWLDKEAQRLGADLAELLGGSGLAEKGRVNSVWNVGLVEAFVADANDPEVQLAAWLRDGCPAGVAHGIPHCGIFPTTSPKDRVGSSITEHLQEHEPSSNYASVSEEFELSGAEVDRLIEKGYAVKYDEWKDVLAEFGDALVSKLACIIKVREDGTKKVRNVLDLRRSGYNEHVNLEERIVLPRLGDLIKDAVDLSLAGREGGGEVFGMIADFEDAFHTLGVAPCGVEIPNRSASCLRLRWLPHGVMRRRGVSLVVGARSGLPWP
jgi:hypothetical protein